jgi:chemotaxis protein MotB
MAVVKHLQDRAVDPTKLSAAGYGSYQPIAPNDSPENKSLNRRIEIVLTSGPVGTAERAPGPTTVR